MCSAMLITLRVEGQMAMPDNVCIGQTKHYNVDPTPGSTYIWKINGVVQAGFNANEFDNTWTTSNTYLLEVHELSANGCLAPARSGQVFVTAPVNPVFAEVGPYCSGSAIPLLPTISVNGISGTWSPAINNNASTVYTFTPMAGSCATNTSMIITIYPKPTAITTDLSYYNGFNVSCFGISDGYIRINTSDEPGTNRYNWTGPGNFTTTAKDISGLKAGKYELSITNASNCTTLLTYILTEPPPLNMKITKSVSSDGGYNINCAGYSSGSISLEPLNQQVSVRYLWSDGSALQNRIGLRAGIYSVIIIDGNNCQNDSTIILIEPDSLNIKLEATQPLCPDKPNGSISSAITGGVPYPDYNYRWSDNSTGKKISDLNEGEYGLIVTDQNGCSVRDSIKLNSLHETCVIIPNAISPNGDLINDVWNISNIDLYPLIEIKIFNSWGEMVWKSEQGYPVPWDGTSKGAKLPVDAYFYIIDLHNGSRPIGGSVTIIAQE